MRRYTYRGSDTGRVMQQLVWHVVALDHGLPSEKYGVKTAHRVLVVFEGEAALAGGPPTFDGMGQHP